ncbi:MAG TPA: hypothetical protein VM487_20125 [Phycisphaerae bacterium]|nr:hypothetical protein [Phycisphaerae bacterium]
MFRGRLRRRLASLFTVPLALKLGPAPVQLALDHALQLRICPYVPIL